MVVVACSSGLMVVDGSSFASIVVVASSIVWLILKGVLGLRPTEEEEMSGLDVSELGMEAYPEFRN